MGNREIKFRAWDIKNKSMHLDRIPKDEEYWDGIDLCNLAMINSCLEKDSFVFMQYTGLKDKNGKEIYEGDIVAKWRKPWKELAYIDGNITVEFKDLPNQNGWNICQVQNLEVIGNIYENPELL